MPMQTRNAPNLSSGTGLQLTTTGGRCYSLGMTNSENRPEISKHESVTPAKSVCVKCGLGLNWNLRYEMWESKRYGTTVCNGK